MTLPTNWQDGQTVHASDENAVDAAINANTAAIASLETVVTAAFATHTSAYTLTTSDATIAADATSGAFPLTLPTAVGIVGKQFTIVKVDSTVNAVTITGTSGQTINGLSSALLVFAYQRITVISNGINWLVLDSNYVGRELGYAQTSTSASSSNTGITDAALSANKIAGLSITVTGIGRPVKVEFVGQGYNTVANIPVVAAILTNGSAANGDAAVVSSPSASSWRKLYGQCRQILTAGTSYTFEVGMWTTSGTAVYYADATTPLPLQLSVVSQ